MTEPRPGRIRKRCDIRQAVVCRHLEEMRHFEEEQLKASYTGDE
jgi:hypothetical protein